jgi:hypothetical protein
MMLEMTHEECQLLAELLTRRLDEVDVEEHRSETWHYKDMLHKEHAILGGLQDKVQRLLQAAPAPTASAK